MIRCRPATIAAKIGRCTAFLRVALPWVGAMALIASAGSVRGQSTVPPPDLMPLPQTVLARTGDLAVGGPFSVLWQVARSRMLQFAVERFQRDVGRLAGWTSGAAQGPTLRIECACTTQSAIDTFPDEGYNLTVAGDTVLLTARSPVGVLRGLATLRQLIQVSSGAVSLPRVEITDAPRFAWRGIMIDVTRHFMSIEALKRQIDAMELVNLNVLHLHLSDNEGFRVESLRYPKLQAISSHGQYYTQAEIRELVAYANMRGVEIVPEFDVPAHVTAILQAYPHLRTTPVDPKDLLAPDKATVDPSSEATYRFLTRLFHEMAALFPSRYFHFGGDEVMGGAWDRAAQVQSFMKAHGLSSQVQMEAYFHRRLARALQKDGKTVIGWEEIAAGDMPSNVVVQVWRTPNGTAAATAKGYKTIVSIGYYFDNLWPAASHYQIDPYDVRPDDPAGVEPPLAQNQPPPLTQNQERLVLGAEGELWSELVTEEMLDARLWPRAAALAERCWSRKEVRDTADMYRRLAVTLDELRRLGLQDADNQARMAERLAPGNATPVSTLLSLVGPVRNGAHNHQIRAWLRREIPPPQPLTGLADAASPDSVVTQRFEEQARAFIKGDRSIAPYLTHSLEIWRDNDTLFAPAAHGRPELEAALPVAAEIATLAQSGLDAVAAIEAKQPMAADALTRARAALEKAKMAEAASARTYAQPLPPADLIIAITGGIGLLVDAAAAL